MMDFSDAELRVIERALAAENPSPDVGTRVGPTANLLARVRVELALREGAIPATIDPYAPLVPPKAKPGDDGSWPVLKPAEPVESHDDGG